jgi:hypothetical protein
MGFYLTTDGDNDAGTVALGVLSREWLTAQTVCDLPPGRRAAHDALIAAELLRLRRAYPTQARNFSEEEARATGELWAEIFAGVDPVLLHEAVLRFIVTDRKGYFPAPGQIAGCVERIAAEREGPKEEYPYGYR